MKQALELYTSKKITLEKVLLQINRLLELPQQQLDNKVLLIQFMRDLKRASIQTNNDHLKRCYLNLSQGIARMVNNKPKSPLSWKEALLTSAKKTRVSLSDITVIGNFHLTVPCELSDFKIVHSDNLKFSCAMGITCADNRAHIQKQTKLSLDADYSLGATGTTADGIGVYHDSEANKMILKAAKLTAKYLTLIAENYNKADHLYAELPIAFLIVKRLITDYFKQRNMESSCCILTKIFTVDEKSCEVITGSVGDCMAFAWDPVSKQITMLATARQFDFFRCYNPASITDKQLGIMLQKTRTILPKSAFVFRLTDGAWQMLPNIQSKVKYDDTVKSKYFDISIDEGSIKQMLTTILELNPNANEQTYCDALVKKVITNINLTKASITKILSLLNNDYVIKYSENFKIDKAKIQYSEFTDWLSKYDPEMFFELNLTLCRLEYVPELMSSAIVIDIINSLTRNLEMGDDATISVQSCNEIFSVPESQPKNRGCFGI